MSLAFSVASAVIPARGRGQDRVATIELLGTFVLVVADGSGGMRGGGEAAEHALSVISDAVRGAESVADPAWWTAVIARVDGAAAPRGGQCALVAAALSARRIVGASAGDCGAWLVSGRIDELTDGQVRKPLVGSGEAVPVGFEAELGAGTLLLASDGLLKYAPRNAIAALARSDDLHAAAQSMAKLPQLRSGAMPDDVAVVLCRATRG